MKRFSLPMMPLFVAVLCAVFLLCSEQARAATIVGRLSHSSAADSTYDVGAKKFAELTEQYTNGAVRIEVYPNAQLGSDRDAAEGQRMGTVDFSLPGGSLLSQYNPKFSIFNLPFLFSSKKEAYDILDGKIGEEIYSLSKPLGLEVLASMESGFRQVSSATRLIKTVADLKGVKIRIPDGQLYLKSWQALGVNPTVIPWNEVFTALQTGVVEGVEVPLSSFNSAGLGEVCKNFTFINYMYDPVLILASSSFMNKLSPEQQAAVKRAAREAADYERAYNTKLETDLQAKLESKGVRFHSPDLSEFQAAMTGVYKSYADQETLRKVLAALGR